MQIIKHSQIRELFILSPDDLDALCQKYKFGNLYEIIRDIDYIWELFSNECDLWDFLNLTLDLDKLNVSSEAEYLYLKLKEFVRELEKNIGLSIVLSSTYFWDGDGFDCPINLPSFFFEVRGVFQLSDQALNIKDFLVKTDLILL